MRSGGSSERLRENDGTVFLCRANVDSAFGHDTVQSIQSCCRLYYREKEALPKKIERTFVRSSYYLQDIATIEERLDLVNFFLTTEGVFTSTLNILGEFMDLDQMLSHLVTVPK